MPNIYDIAPKELWDEAFASKLINRQVHPTLPLEIYDYSQVAQFSKSWNAATLASRGLIVDSATKEIVSRPLGKFFNYGEPSGSDVVLEGPIVASDKADGSMAVSYPTPDGSLNISTRGSFASDQAKHATALYLDKYNGKWEPKTGYTYIWEIIYPTNRIVLNYGDKDDLILISRVDNATGISIPASQVAEWLWERVEEFGYTTLAEVLAAPQRENAEGLVVHFLNSDARVKIKQEDYVYLHRIITGASSRRIHEMLAAGEDLQAWLVGLPDEFVDFVENTRDSLLAQFAELQAKVDATYEQIVSELPVGYTQKEFALYVNANYADLRKFLFSKQKGSNGDASITKAIWQQIEPPFEKPFWNLNGKVD